MDIQTFTFIVTKACQLQCKYCYLVGKNTNERMSLDVAKKAVDFIFQSKVFMESDNFVFDFIGGEPLLEIDLINEIMEYISEKLDSKHPKWEMHYEIRITTNGLLYSSEKVQAFINKYKERLHISISIDGNKEKNDINRIFSNGDGSYNKIIDNVHLWKKQFPNEGTKMTISHDDLPFVYESIKHLLELGITTIDVNHVVENVWQEGDDKVFEQQLINVADYIIDNNLWNKINITAFHQINGHSLPKGTKLDPCGSMMYSVDANGDMYSCLRFSQFSLRSKQARTIGNVYDGIDINKLRPMELVYNDVITPQKCYECEVASGCKWCPAEAYDSSHTGSVFAKTTFSCKMHKAKVRAKNYYWNKLNKKIQYE